MARSSSRFRPRLLQGIRKAGLPCHMLPDGASVRISRHVMHEPDALVYCGPELPDDAIEVPNPVILVEVASPSTRKIDDTVKLDRLFQPAERAALPDRRSRRPARRSTTAARPTGRS